MTTPHLNSRRTFLRTAALTAASAHLLPRTLLAQAAAQAPADRLQQMIASAANAKITTQPLRGNVSALLGSGGNIAVLPGKGGKLLIDSGFSSSRPQISEALAAISPDPLTHLVNTHWHFDHTDGNPWMHEAGAVIIAQDNTKVRLSSTQHLVAFGLTIPPIAPAGLPTETFAQDRTLEHNGETLHLSHYAPAHTDTDISIHFANADILHAGDTWFNGIYPFIDYSSGGNIDGMIVASNRNLKQASAKTIIIPGHGPIGDRTQLESFRDMLVGVRETVATMKKQGRSLEEIVAAKPTAPYDSKFKPGTGPVESFIGLVYQGV